jgi:hypothetical protein
MLTSLSLSFYSHGRPGGESIMEQAPIQAPTESATAPAPAESTAPSEDAAASPKEEAKPIAPDAGTGDQ